jgi:hypothetical protein
MPSSSTPKARKRTKAAKEKDANDDMAARNRAALTTTLQGTPVVPRFSRAAEDDAHVAAEEKAEAGEKPKRPLSRRDRRAMAILILLCESRWSCVGVYCAAHTYVGN